MIFKNIFKYNKNDNKEKELRERLNNIEIKDVNFQHFCETQLKTTEIFVDKFIYKHASQNNIM